MPRSPCSALMVSVNSSARMITFAHAICDEPFCDGWTSFRLFGQSARRLLETTEDPSNCGPRGPFTLPRFAPGRNHHTTLQIPSEPCIRPRFSLACVRLFVFFHKRGCHYRFNTGKKLQERTDTLLKKSGTCTQGARQECRGWGFPQDSVEI